jgi:hypothetical protein
MPSAMRRLRAQVGNDALRNCRRSSPPPRKRLTQVGVLQPMGLGAGAAACTLPQVRFKPGTVARLQFTVHMSQE